MLPIEHRWSRKEVGKARQNNATYKFRVMRLIESQVTEVVVCRTAFIAIHRITKGKIEHLVSSLKSTGLSPKDKRGKHDNRPWKHTEETKAAIKTHIASFPARESHYGLKDSNKTEVLNVKKMYELFKEAYPSIVVSEQSYREVFNTEFNIAFGYPRTDTSSACDECSAKLQALEKEECPDSDSMVKIEASIKRLKTKNEVHK